MTPWDEIKGKIQDLFNSPEEDLSKHCNEWRRAFSKLLNYKKFKYSSKAWREEALEPKKTKDNVGKEKKKKGKRDLLVSYLKMEVLGPLRSYWCCPGVSGHVLFHPC